MNKPVKSVIVVGGGTAGWITAGRIAAKHRCSSESAVQVTLIESPNINIIGVGEGTWPTMRNTLMKLGISETDFMRACDATFKQGAKFARWVDGSRDDFYYHPLMLPQGFGRVDLCSYWQAQQGRESFSNAVCFQEQVCERGLAPKLITTPEFGSVANYAYHLDAGKFARFLQNHCVNQLGVRHILDDVVGVQKAKNGDIESLKTAHHGDLSGDLFVDCTGFRSRLLGDEMDVPLVDRSDVLFIDTAIAVQVPYEQADDPIASHTISTGQEAGWIWDIGLTRRRGVGYVYSSKHTSEENAQDTLAQYVGPAIEQLDVRKIPIRSGHRQLFWKNNCVAVGLSAGFLEPLEASALVLVELSAEMLAEQLPATRGVMDICAQRFNDTFQYRWDRIIDFLKLHYILSKRTDNDFWNDNRDPTSIPDSLQALMSLWQYRSPGDQDFTSNNEVFPAASYQYVLYGMGFKTETAAYAHTLIEQELAREQFGKNRMATERALAGLPRHRDLINKIHEYGFAAV
ncbi:tryptophan 7-halogenase [Pseudomaricurvus alkylphenolicus]|uniref:tryptophan halogenase family protein n=1 Tax=Pseudomaricurvus alkylphenolicus TaxID=1306991 RepID=UPI00141F50D3|nr:tryptophan halogenase family protein [Pseudomaricurvus alkylphenolicus]NIB40922.1 tryptophan 7-halogenase [Pseudomaricurvus alkylphenolicus]